MKIENKKGKVQVTKSFFNYVGVGADAQAALQVHMLRESQPNLFSLALSTRCGTLCSEQRRWSKNPT
jgi:predicted sugar kinase